VGQSSSDREGKGRGRVTLFRDNTFKDQKRSYLEKRANSLMVREEGVSLLTGDMEKKREKKETSLLFAWIKTERRRRLTLWTEGGGKSSLPRRGGGNMKFTAHKVPEVSYYRGTSLQKREREGATSI